MTRKLGFESRPGCIPCPTGNDVAGEVEGSREFSLEMKTMRLSGEIEHRCLLLQALPGRIRANRFSPQTLILLCARPYIRGWHIRNRNIVLGLLQVIVWEKTDTWPGASHTSPRCWVQQQTSRGPEYFWRGLPRNTWDRWCPLNRASVNK